MQARRPVQQASNAAGQQSPRSGPRLVTLLVCLVLAVLLPALGVGSAAVWYVTTSAQGTARARLKDTAQALALMVDREITGHMAALQTLAASPEFYPDPSTPDLPALYAHAKRVADLLGTPITVFRRDGTPVLNTQRPLGDPLPPNVSPEMITRVFNTGRAAVGDVVRSPYTGRFVAGAFVPVTDQSGKVALVIVRAWDVLKLRELFIAQGLPPDSFAGIVDGRNNVLLRSDAFHDQVVGRPAAPDNIAR
jgi:hypothetical protein